MELTEAGEKLGGQVIDRNENETGAYFVKNAKNLKLSDRTKAQIIALAQFEDSFWHLSDVLTRKSENKEIQDAFNKEAEKTQKKARDSYYEAINEMITLVKNEIFQTLFDSGYKEL